MQKYIVLFRGINVGGNNLLPMKTLVPLLEKEGFKEVAYYIQSGNVILKSDSKTVTKTIKDTVFTHFGFTPEILLIEVSNFESIIINNPYHELEGKFVHFYFCANTIQLNQDKLDKYIADSESYTLTDNIFYLHAPNGIGRSKLVANIEACLDQAATGRNLNTINKINAMLTKP